MTGAGLVCAGILGCDSRGGNTVQVRYEKLNQSVLDRLVSTVVSRKDIFGAVFYVSSDDDRIDVISSAGDIEADSRYFIASINKLFISSIILKLHTEKRLDLRDGISRYLSEEMVRGLHVYEGKDYSKDLTIFHLMSQTSGLPCYLIDRQANGIKAMDELEAGIDQPWPFEKVIGEVKKMKPHFPPGKEGKAFYVDTNHQLLSVVIQNVTGEPISLVLKNLFQELNLTKTHVCEDAGKEAFVPIRYKSKTMNIPLFLNSTRNDIISTAGDQMTFLKAFFNGHFFPREKLHELSRWNNIFFPFQYGVGIQKFYMPRILSPMKPVPDMIGHCGSTGAVAFYVPDLKIYITGTVNQQARPNVAFQTMIKICNSIT